MKSKKTTSVQRDYSPDALGEDVISKDPFRQFYRWMQDALDSGIEEPNAMFLATVAGNGRPSGRMVLLKEFDERGFVFFTNYKSRKGVEISKNPYVAVTLHWKELGRQVRITGKVKQVSRLESETYFNTRPLESRINAVISPQSQVIPDRHFLEKRRMELVSSPGIENIRRPEEWGGYRIIPSTFEFWQEMAFRLHDRILYSKKNGKWIIQRLAP